MSFAQCDFDGELNSGHCNRVVCLNNSDIDIASKQCNRVANNINLSHPHALIISAAKDGKNGILQPEDLEGVGEYSVETSTVSPAVSVLCVNMAATELAPLICVDWPNSLTNEPLNTLWQILTWPGHETDVSQEFWQRLFLKSTVVDNIFHWREALQRRTPVFPMLPTWLPSDCNAQ
ncbi:hypothetical protein BJ878DRAFT_561312 [Calycina marina]|uniref:Uncharacterized protein n=1 Tax=Calycina marina TaxID=1763456 RepID=A0A9P7YV40_9HELO|nr:hypothetical protein BJ878DRAFT_561312 [Calycina marina]